MSLEPWYGDDSVTVYAGDCLEVLPELPDASIDAVVCDPPYGLEFMGREWDSFKPARAKLRTREDQRTNPSSGKSTTVTPEAYVAGDPFGQWCRAWATECLRVLKPGGHLLAFGGTRTYHWLTWGIELAGFEIRDSIHWIYGAGFPKSLDVSKAIDKQAGEQCEVVGVTDYPGREGWTNANGARSADVYGTLAEARLAKHLTAPATENARRWHGWGTALRPSHEPIVVARKPIRGTVAANVLTHGTGALNIDACRVAAAPGDYDHPGNDNRHHTSTAYNSFEREGRQAPPNGAGRWPANVFLSGEAADELDRQSGLTPGGGADRGGDTSNGYQGGIPRGGVYARDTGGASRFFPVFRYEPKADSAERPTVAGVKHPTVKPLDLMRWLVRLVCPPGGVVLDPFLGSGTTAEAARLEGFRCIGVERERDYLPLIKQRLDRHTDAHAYLESRGELEDTLFDLADTHQPEGDRT